MNVLKQKLSNKNGFTLMEMLIVVAIIAILIAIAIPALSASLDKARQASDDANLRSAKAVAIIKFMTDKDFDSTQTYYYAVGTNSEGDLDTNKPSPGYGQCAKHKGKVIEVTYENGQPVVVWETKDACG